MEPNLVRGEMLVSYSKRETKNLGNYESISVEIKIEDEMDPATETSEQCLMRLKTFVNNSLKNELQGTPVANTSDIKQQILALIKLDENNKIIIKTMLAGFGVNKVSELGEKSLIALSKKLNKLRETYE